MNTRERFLATFHFGNPSRGLLWEWHYMQGTVDRWHQEGLPDWVFLPHREDPEYQIRPFSAAAERFHGKRNRVPIGTYWNLDRGQPYCPGEVANVPADTGMVPPFDEIELDSTATKRIVRDAEGITKEVLLGQEPAMPRFLTYPVRCRQDWEELKSRYISATPERYPTGWAEYVSGVAQRDYPIGLKFDGLFGRLRRWLGTEHLMYTLYDDPVLFEDMCEFHTQFLLEVLDRALSAVRIDYVNIWEDMAYKAGPLISPRHVRQHMLPRYRRLADRLRAGGIDVLFVDSDGNVDELIPIWLEAGINGVWPLEIAAGTDPLELRRKYGRELLLVGGIDKRELTKGVEHVRTEVMGKVPHLLSQGGYVATVDHSVPPDVPLRNYVYFRKLLADLAGQTVENDLPW